MQTTIKQRFLMKLGVSAHIGSLSRKLTEREELLCDAFQADIDDLRRDLEAVKKKHQTYSA